MAVPKQKKGRGGRPLQGSSYLIRDEGRSWA